MSREAAETAGFWSRRGKGTSQRDHKRRLGSRRLQGRVPQGHGEWHGCEAWAGGVYPQLGHTEQPCSLGCRSTKPRPHSNRPGGQINAGRWGGKAEAGAGSRERGSSGGPTLCPLGSSTASSLGKRLYLQAPAKPLQPLPYFFLTSCCTKGCSEASAVQTLAESTLQWALGGRWEPHACCSLHAGHRRDPGVWAAWQGPGVKGPGSSWSRAAPARSLHPSCLAPVRCCPWGAQA